MTQMFKIRCLLRHLLVSAALMLPVSAFLFVVSPAYARTAHFYGTDNEVVALAFWVAQNSPDKNWDQYEHLPPQEKARLKKKLREWEALPPEKQKALRRKMEQLKRMPPEARQLYQRRFNQWQKLPPGERREIRKKLENWDNLPPGEKERIRRKFRN